MRSAMILALALAALGGPEVLADKGSKGGGGGGGKGGGGKGDDGGAPADPAILFTVGDDIAVMDVDGGNPTVVLPNTGNPFVEPAFSPDGTQVYFNGDGPRGAGIYRVDLDGSDLQFITPLQSVLNGGPQVSPGPAPDGRDWILFTDNTPDDMSDLFLVELDGSNRINLTQSTDRAEVWSSWSPDATRVVATMISLDPTTLFEDCYVYDLAASGGLPVITSEVSIVNVPGSPLQDNTALAWPDWARSSDRIAITATVSSGGSSYDIWVVDLLDPGHPQNATETFGRAERSSSWSPDDTSLVFWSTGPGPDGVFLLDATMSEPVRLYRDGSKPDWRRF